MSKKFKHVEFDKSNLVDLSADTTDSGRFYTVPHPKGHGSIKYPSVTTVTGWDKREFFEKWSKDPKNAVERDRASERGNIIHDRIEQYLGNDPEWLTGIEMNERSLLGLMRPELDKIDNIYGLELPLYSHALKMAGRCDCIGEFDGKLSIIDFKGSTRNKKPEWIQNYFHQGTCYSLMFQELTGIVIPNVVIIVGSEQGLCQVFSVNVMDFMKPLVEVRTKYFTENEGVLNEKFSI